MCGIIGFIQKEKNPSALQKMMDGIAHRGPDGQGSEILESQGWKIHFGHTRLSIIDLEGGKQPLFNLDKSLAITFNGEIFNFQELRPDLEKKYSFQTKSDTEVLVHYYAEYGTNGLKNLNGMYAFALFDSKKGEVILARDPAGIKPLYFAPLDDGGLLFASELAALLAHPKAPKTISKEALSCYFTMDYSHPPHSIIEGVYKLAPGHFLVWKNGEISAPREFLDLTKVEERKYSEKEAVSLMSKTLEKAIERQMIADVPVGVFLSGGIDSSTVAAIAQKHSSRKLSTFSIAFDDPAFDESHYARVVAKHIGSEHHEQTFTEIDLLKNIDRVLDTIDEPMADPSLLPTYFLSTIAAKKVKVVLGGDAGDELFAGYPTYLADRYGNFFGNLPTTIRKYLFSSWIKKLRPSDRYQSLEMKLKRFVLRWHDKPFHRHLQWVAGADPKNISNLVCDYVDPISNILRSKTLGTAKNLNSMLRLDFKTYMVDSVLTKVDRASMANGLEVRPPMLDHDFVRLAFSIPFELKLRGTKNKYVLRKLAKKHLPREIFSRGKKGFAIPLSKWMKTALKPRIEQILVTSPVWEKGYLYRDALVEINEAHQTGKFDHSKTLWAVLVLDHWMKKYEIR